jgi:hypothetical protein
LGNSSIASDWLERTQQVWHILHSILSLTLSRKNIELIESSMLALCFEDDAPQDTQQNLLCGAYGTPDPMITLFFVAVDCECFAGSEAETADGSTNH